MGLVIPMYKSITPPTIVSSFKDFITYISKKFHQFVTALQLNPVCFRFRIRDII